MNFKSDNEHFNEIVSKFNGNRYQAVQYIQKQSRKLLEYTDNRITDSEAITWVLTGEKPDYESRKTFNEITAKYEDAYVDEILCYIDDKQVCESIRLSISKSKKSKNLVYRYTKGLDETQKSRVRVVTRMIWYKLFNWHLEVWSK